MSDDDSFSDVQTASDGSFQLKIHTAPSEAEPVVASNSSTIRRSGEWFKVTVGGTCTGWPNQHVHFRATDRNQPFEPEELYRRFKSLYEASGVNMDVFVPSSERDEHGGLYEKNPVHVPDHGLQFVAHCGGHPVQLGALVATITPMMRLEPVPNLGTTISADDRIKSGPNQTRLGPISLKHAMEDGPSMETLTPIQVTESGWHTEIAGGSVPAILRGGSGTANGSVKIHYSLESKDNVAGLYSQADSLLLSLDPAALSLMQPKRLLEDDSEDTFQELNRSVIFSRDRDSGDYKATDISIDSKVFTGYLWHQSLPQPILQTTFTMALRPLCQFHSQWSSS